MKKQNKYLSLKRGKRKALKRKKNLQKKSRTASHKPKHSKVLKLIRLAKLRKRQAAKRKMRRKK